MRIIKCEQYTDEWWAARLGIPTSSQFSRIITGKGEPSTSRGGYINELAAERLTGKQEDTYVSRSMQKGSEREGLARQMYEMEFERKVKEVGICLSDCGRWGASTDGLIQSKGVLELKNPKGGTHVGRLLDTKKLPSSAHRQVQGELFVTEREWCDFVSYVPGLPLFCVRAYPDMAFHQMMKSALIEFCEELDAVCLKIAEMETYTFGEVS